MSTLRSRYRLVPAHYGGQSVGVGLSSDFLCSLGRGTRESSSLQISANFSMTRINLNIIRYRPHPIALEVGLREQVMVMSTLKDDHPTDIGSNMLN